MVTTRTAQPAAKKPVKTAAKAPVTPTAKAVPAPVAKPIVAPAPAAVKAPAKAAAPKVQPKADKPSKVKKPKLVRDSFTIPKTEYVVLDALKTRATGLGKAVKKSELLRAGIKALAAMTDATFSAALSNVPTIKTGRPKKEAPAKA